MGALITCSLSSFRLSLLSFILFLLHIRPSTSHYKGSCIGTDEPATNSYCTDDNIYVYVCMNHDTFHDTCFTNYENQARVDVSQTSPAFSWRPSVKNFMGKPAPMIDVFACNGPTAESTNNICKVAPGNEPDHCSCNGQANRKNWYRYGPINQIATPTNLLASIYGAGCETEEVMRGGSLSFSTKSCSNTYPAYAVKTPCTGNFPCGPLSSGSSENAPSILEASNPGVTISHLDYRDCDTCSTIHVSRPSCDVIDGSEELNTLTDLQVFPTVEWSSTTPETSPIYELANDAGGRFAIEPGTNKLVTGATKLDYELGADPSGLTEWTCTTNDNTKCFTGDGIQNQADYVAGKSSWDPNTKEWTIYVYVTDVQGCRATGGSTFKSGPFAIKIKVKNVLDAPSTVLLSLVSTVPMNSNQELLELHHLMNTIIIPWDCSNNNRKVGILSYSNNGDCDEDGVTCVFECQSSTNNWVNGNSHLCGGPNKNTFKIVNSELLLATSSLDALNYEGGSSGAVSAITVRVTATVDVNDFPTSISSNGIVLTIPIANVNEAPTDVIFTSAGSIPEETAADTIIGTLTTSDPDMPLTSQTYTYIYDGPPGK